MQRPQSWVYNAFLSYSHSDEVRLAGDVQRALHRIARPWYRLRALRVFRDKSNIAPTESLWGSIVEALQSAEFFLLLASPGAAASPWVAREVDWWLKQRGTHNFILVAGGGTVAWDNEKGDFDPTLSTSVPPTLFGRFANEPLWVDVSFAATNTDRKIRDRLQAELLPVAARLHHKAPDVLGGEDLRRRRSAYLLASGLVLLALAALSIGLFMAREAQEQSARAIKERLGRTAELAAQSIADGGVSAQAIAQLAHAAQASASIDAQRHKFVLGYWLQYLVPAQELMERMSPANWGNDAYVISDRKFVGLEGGRKTRMALSPRLPVAYAADAGRSRFSIHRLSDGKAVASTDISDLNVDVETDTVHLYELAEGKVLLLQGLTQSGTAADYNLRLVFMRVDGSEALWLKPVYGHSVRIDTGCQRFEVIERSDELDSPPALKSLTVQPDGSIRVDRRELKDDAPELAARRMDHFQMLRSLEDSCNRFQVPFVGRDLPFPRKHPESELWKDAGQHELQALDPRAMVLGSLSDSTRALTQKERTIATARMRTELPKLVVHRDKTLASALTSLPRGSGPEAPDLTYSDGLELMLDDLETDTARAIDAPDGLVIWTTHSRGAQHGEHTLCKLGQEIDGVRCTILVHHGDFGAHTISSDGHFFLAADRTYLGHESFGLIDLLTMEVVPIVTYPYGTVIAADFDTQRSLLATMSASGDIYVYRLRPKVELISRSTANVPVPDRESWPEFEASCFRLIGENVVYCNANGGLTAVSAAGAEVLWTTRRVLRSEKNASILWHNGSSIAVLGTSEGFLLFRPDDGVMLSDWIASVAPQNSTIKDVALGADDTVYAKVNQRWYRRLSPLTPEQVLAALAQIECLTGFERGAIVKRAEPLHCTTNN